MTKRLKHNIFSNLVVNLVAKSTKKATLNGKDYLVVPMVMLTEGVHQGSNGPLYYPNDELAKTPVVWNTKPLVVYHPERNGEGVSATLPEVLQTRSVGMIMNTTFDGQRLKAEAWIEEERADAVDDRILKAVRNNQMMEVSTGLYCDISPEEGTWNKKKYTGVARNYRPDHLAILPDMIGACSVADGAGLLRNRAQRRTAAEYEAVLETLAAKQITELSFMQIETLLWKALTDRYGIKPMGNEATPWIKAVYSNFFVYEYLTKTYRLGYELTDTGSVVLDEDAPQPVQRIEKYIPVENYSEDQPRDDDGKFSSSGGGGGGGGDKGGNKGDSGKDGVSKAFGKLSTEQATKLGRLLGRRDLDKAYTTDQIKKEIEAGRLEITDGGVIISPTGFGTTDEYRWDSAKKQYKVVKDQGYMTKNGQQTKNQKRMKKKQIEAIITANAGWQEEDREKLEALSEEQVAQIHNAVTAKPPVKNADDEEDEEGDEKEGKDGKEGEDDEKVENAKPTTLQDWMAKAPTEVKRVVNRSLQIEQQEKTRLSDAILANANNPYTKEELLKKSVEELSKLSQLAATPDFTGLGFGATRNTAPAIEQPLPVPTLNFAKAKS